VSDSLSPLLHPTLALLLSPLLSPLISPILSPHSYSLSGGDGQFSINPSTGQIISSSLLDRETRSTYQLLVVATDGGEPQGLSSSATVSVVVSDVNDNPPRFHHHPYVTHIPAYTSAGGWNPRHSAYSQCVTVRCILKKRRKSLKNIYKFTFRKLD
jgi:hypothetical protein